MSDQNAFHRLIKNENSTENEDKIDSETKFIEFCLQEIFRVTKSGIKKEHYDALKYVDRTSLGLDAIDDILMEQLGLYEVKSFNRFNYLKSCYCRCNKDSILSDKKVDLSIYNPKSLLHISDAIVRYAITYGIESSVFNSNQSGFELYDFICSSGYEPNSLKFLNDIRSKLELDQYKQFFDQTLSVAVGKLKLHTHYVTDPSYLEAADLLNYFTSDENMATVLTDSSTFFPLYNDETPEGYLNTFLGQLFNAVCTHAHHKNPIYFNSKTMSNMEISNTIHSINTSLSSIYDKLTSCLKRLLGHARFKNFVFCWFYGFLTAFSDRSKLKSSMLGAFFDIHDGIFANVCYVTLKILQPITDDPVKLINRVDYSYCHSDHKFITSGNHSYTLNFSEETRLKIDEKVSIIDKSFNFITHWFFLVGYSFKIGLIPAFENIEKLEKEAMELSDHNKDLDQNDMSRPFNILQNELLCRRTQILAPKLCSLIIEYCSGFCIYIINLIGLNITTPFEDLIENFKPDTSKLNAIPEYLFDQVASIIILHGKLIGNFSDEFDNQKFIITLCFCLLMGQKECISNPHLRAKLAEALFFISNDDFKHSKSNILLDRYSVLHKILPNNLVQLFVDIEFTGHHNEFFQKFSYRFYMYQILFRIWNIPEYLLKFRSLSSEIHPDSEGQLPLFLRFVNLLINDATFLLDDALSKLSKIHEIENELATMNLEEEEKKEKLNTLETERNMVKSVNILSKDNLESLKLIATSTPVSLLCPSMVDRVAVVLNFFLQHLVGDKKRTLKVNDMASLKFEPRKLVTIICEIFVSLAKSDNFCRAVINDERSFKENLPDLALGILMHINASPILIERFQLCKTKLLDMFKNKNEEIYSDEIPDEFLDPISYALMRDPVMLPQSKVVVDRNTITKHLLSDQTDPFNRSHLTLTMVIPQHDLKNQIDQWIKEQSSAKKS